MRRARKPYIRLAAGLSLLAACAPADTASRPPEAPPRSARSAAPTPLAPKPAPAPPARPELARWTAPAFCRAYAGDTRTVEELRAIPTQALSLPKVSPRPRGAARPIHELGPRTITLTAPSTPPLFVSVPPADVCELELVRDALVGADRDRLTATLAWRDDLVLALAANDPASRDRRETDFHDLLAVEADLERRFHAAGTPVALHAAAVLRERRATGLEEEGALPLLLSVAERALAGGKGTPREPWLMLRVARLRADVGRRAEAKTMLDALARGPLTWATTSALFAIGSLLEESEDSDLAAATFRAIARSETNADIVVAALARGLLLAHARGRHEEALALAVAILERKKEDPSFDAIRERATEIAVLEANALHPGAETWILSQKGDVLARLGDALANDAVLRFDLRAATRAWEAVLKGAPGSVEAARASSGLVAIADATGSPKAQLLRRDHKAKFDPDGPWGIALERGGSSPVLRQRIVDAATGTGVARAVQPTDGARLDYLVGCLGRRSRRPSALVVRPVEIDVKVEVFSEGEARATATGASALDTACIVKEAPRVFVDAPAGVHAVVTVSL